MSRSHLRIGLSVLVPTFLFGCAQERVYVWSSPNGSPPPATSVNFRELDAAGGAMAALTQRRDVAAHNLANAQTPGFKARRLIQSEGSSGQGSSSAVRIVAEATDMTSGAPVRTDRTLDLMICGEGFFTVRGTDGVLYTRNGQFTLNTDREIVTCSGYRLASGITIPPDATGVSITAGGKVMVTKAGAVDPEEVGEIEIAMFVAPDQLVRAGDNLFAACAAAGDAKQTTPGLDRAGTLVQGCYEASNVVPELERLELVRVERLLTLWDQAIIFRVDRRTAAVDPAAPMDVPVSSIP